ncbi:cytochrome P450 [Streptomyces kaniharaensis]|uniref:Cytochrome P450 n=1 Tax=Streptomyces kaniharaensis TaxID=212423 RepID=A0A6N7KKY0_9ACTN|nr:cytochrome P450 [Streptomyces kaniharaensis]MQS11209.1 cytochrome P450 [Streptomyces kaniharaensis]
MGFDQARVNRLFLPETYAEGVPYGLFRELRAAAPVCWVEEPAVGDWPAGPGYWAVLRHADVKHVLRSPEDFSSRLGATQIRDPDSAADLDFARTMMLNQDPPDHSRLRRAVAAAFTPRALHELTVAIESRAAELVAAIRPSGEADFVPIAADLPVWTLARILGVPEQDRQLLVDWSNRVIGYQDPDYAESSSADPSQLTDMGRAALVRRPVALTAPDGRPVNPRSRAALADMFAYAHALAEQPPPGSMVARMREAGLSAAEFETMFFLFGVAGNETLRNGLPGGLYSLLTHADQYGRLSRRPDLIPSAVEELLRFWPPVLEFRRTATRDVMLAGKPIRSGDKVVVYHASANRDESVFPDPDRLDITRTPNDHVSFGFGPHFCVGARLARIQMSALIRRIVSELPGLELASGAPPKRLVSNFQNGLKSLPVRWRAEGGPAGSGQPAQDGQSPR